MSKKTYYSRAQYVLAHGLIQSYFEDLPALPFLSDRKNERKLFERYIQWGPYAQSWTYWQRSLLLNLYEKQRARKTLSKAPLALAPLHFWGLLLKYYLYSAKNPASSFDFLQAHPFLDESLRENYQRLSPQGSLPDFQKTLKACLEPALPAYQPTLLFSSSISAKALSLTQILEETLAPPFSQIARSLSPV